MDKKDSAVSVTESERVPDQNQDQNQDQNSQNDAQAADTAEEGQGSGDEQEMSPEDFMASRLAVAEEEAKEHYERLLRVSADFENYKKRSAREMRDAIRYANEKLAKDLLSVVDNLERAIESASKGAKKDDPVLKGVHLTLDDILKILEHHHVTPIKAVGEPFDPNYHQAMMQVETDDQPPNTVADELQKGYMIHERLLRPTLVSVSKAGRTDTEHND
jgi:molecular chaperone GrpE